MEFPYPLIEGVLVKRYKRFLADVELPDGSVTTAHCSNPGSMLGLKQPGMRVWISDSRNPKRKLQYTLEMVEADGVMVGVNTNHPNRLAREAIEAGLIPQLTGHDRLRTEVKYGKNSRIDILLEKDDGPSVYVEVKNVHFMREKGLHEFPDSVTARGAKHLLEMAEQVKNGHRAAMLYVVQREDGDQMKLAEDLDPEYAKAFKIAKNAGIEAYAVRCTVSEVGIFVKDVIFLHEPILA